MSEAPAIAEIDDANTLIDAVKHIFSYKALVHAVSGACGGSAAMSVFYPLDVIRTVLQVQKNENKSDWQVLYAFIREEGLTAFYRGLESTLISLWISNFVYFYTNKLFKVLVKSFTGQKITVVQNLGIASLAGVVNVLSTCPLWVANTRLKLERKKPTEGRKPYKNTWDCMTRMAKEEGIASLWGGVYASLVLVSNPTIHFAAYDKVKDMFVDYAAKSGRKRLTNVEIFTVGAIAKSLATIVTYPIQIAQTRLRYDAQKHKNMLEVLIRIFKTDGVLGWFAGLNAKLVQTVLTAAFQFLCYERIKEFIFWVMRQK